MRTIIIACGLAASTLLIATGAQAWTPQRTKISGGVCPVRVCAQWAQGAPGTFAGRCVRYTIRMASCDRPVIR